MHDAIQLLLAARGQTADPGLAIVEEYLQAVARRVRARLVNRCSGDFDVVFVDVAVRQADEITGLQDYAETGVAHRVSFDNYPVTTAVLVQRKLLTRIIGAMLGAEEAGPDEEDEERPLTSVEIRIARRVFEDVVHELGEAWPTSSRPGMSLLGRPTATANVKMLPERGEVYAASFEVGLEEELFGTMLVALPVDLVRSLTQRIRAPVTATPPTRKVDLGRAMGLPLDLVAELGRVELPLRRLRELGPGDVVPLGSLDEVRVLVNGRPMLAGEAGERDGRRAFRVLGTVEAD